jgi:predicted transcriptional regulator
VTDRREMGALEHEVLSQLWAFDAPATPAEVLDALDTDLAYTTVMTVLSRLWQKGLISRERRGRAYAYTPVMSEADLTAQRMGETLAAASDRDAALSQFVETLSARDARRLRALLENDTRRKQRRR